MRRLVLVVVPVMLLMTSASLGAARIDSVATPAEALEHGGILRLHSPGQSVEIPLALSSVLIPEDENGTPILEEKTVVLRGISQGATAAMILETGKVSVVANGPDGRVYKAVLSTPDSGARPDESCHASCTGPRGPPDIGGPDFEMGPVMTEERLELGSDTDRRRSSAYYEEAHLLHLSPEGGHSILFSKHIKSDGVARDPVNALFYDLGNADWVDHVLTTSDWNNGVCGSTKIVYFFDEQHGGINHWESQDMDYDKEAIFCLDNRYHIRRFVSNTGDTHTPGFDYYKLTPVHYEDTGSCGVPHCEVDPQAGQDELLSDMTSHHDIQNIWLKLVDFSPGECDSCDNWNGWVDIYQIWEVYNSDPCGQSPSWTIYQWSIVSIKFTCV